MSQIYVDAAKVVSRVVDQKKGYGSNFANNAVFALASQTVRYVSVLKDILTKAGCFADRDCRKFPVNLLLVMAYDLLMSDDQTIRGGKEEKRRSSVCADPKN